MSNGGGDTRDFTVAGDTHEGANDVVAIRRRRKKKEDRSSSMGSLEHHQDSREDGGSDLHLRPPKATTTMTTARATSPVFKASSIIAAAGTAAVSTQDVNTGREKKKTSRKKTTVARALCIGTCMISIHALIVGVRIRRDFHNGDCCEMTYSGYKFLPIPFLCNDDDGGRMNDLSSHVDWYCPNDGRYSNGFDSESIEKEENTTNTTTSLLKVFFRRVWSYLRNLISDDNVEGRRSKYRLMQFTDYRDQRFLATKDMKDHPHGVRSDDRSRTGHHGRETCQTPYVNPGHPVLYIPGHWGSYDQSRSLGAHGLLLTERLKSNVDLQRRLRHLYAGTTVNAKGHGSDFLYDVYALDFGEEGGAIHGYRLWEQSYAVLRAVETIVRRHEQYCGDEEFHRNSRSHGGVTIVAHSVGGIVARAAFALSDDFRGLDDDEQPWRKRRRAHGGGRHDGDDGSQLQREERRRRHLSRLLREHVTTVITLATPHRSSFPYVFDSSVRQLYRAVNSYWTHWGNIVGQEGPTYSRDSDQTRSLGANGLYLNDVQEAARTMSSRSKGEGQQHEEGKRESPLENVTVISFSGGNRDELIYPDQCHLDDIFTASVSAFASDVVHLKPSSTKDGHSCRYGMDHKAIVWCHGVLSLVRNLLDIASKQHRAATPSEDSQRRISGNRSYGWRVDDVASTIFTRTGNQEVVASHGEGTSKFRPYQPTLGKLDLSLGEELGFYRKSCLDAVSSPNLHVFVVLFSAMCCMRQIFNPLLEQLTVPVTSQKQERNGNDIIWCRLCLEMSSLMILAAFACCWNRLFMSPVLLLSAWAVIVDWLLRFVVWMLCAAFLHVRPHTQGGKEKTLQRRIYSMQVFSFAVLFAQCSTHVFDDNSSDGGGRRRRLLLVRMRALLFVVQVAFLAFLSSARILNSSAIREDKRRVGGQENQMQAAFRRGSSSIFAVLPILVGGKFIYAMSLLSGSGHDDGIYAQGDRGESLTTFTLLALLPMSWLYCDVCIEEVPKSPRIASCPSNQIGGSGTKSDGFLTVVVLAAAGATIVFTCLALQPGSGDLINSMLAFVGTTRMMIGQIILRNGLVRRTT